MNTQKKILLIAIALYSMVGVSQARMRHGKKGYLLDSLKTMMGISQELQSNEVRSDVATDLNNELVQADSAAQVKPIEPVVAEIEPSALPMPTTSTTDDAFMRYQDLSESSSEIAPEPSAPEMNFGTDNRINEPVIDEMAQATQQQALSIEDKGYERQTEQDLMKLGNEGFDEQRRRTAVVSMVDQAVAYLKDHNLDDALDAFKNSAQFLNGELVLDVFDSKGICYAHGMESDLIWQNLIDLKDQYNTLIVQNILKKANDGGGWTIYSWRGATKVAYSKQIAKEGQSFIISCGYYPHSKADQVVGLVKGAVAEFNDLVVKLKKPTDTVFSSYSYPMGRFAIGDLYLYVLDFKGTIYAQGDRPGLIGSNALNYQDSKGKFVNQEIIQKLQNAPAGTGVWVKYFSKNAPKLAYAEKVVDNQNKSYFIACGYYPTVTREKAVELTKSAYDYLKRQGKLRAFEAFSSKRNESFRYGDLNVAVLTPTGEIVANGDQPETVGVNIYDTKDEDGAYFAREIIAKAMSGGGWSTYRVRNSFQSSYCEMVQLGLDKYIVVVSLYPVSKQETALLLLKAAVGMLETTDTIESLRAFTKKTGTFVRGDLFVEVYDDKGICLAAGTDYDRIWKKMLDVKDDQGKPYLRLLINSVRRGPARLSYTLNKASRISFAEQVDKENKSYILVTGYYN